tara:strand:+ start:1072 stop:1356 length:285 start_codon:yes stop_codon:yes gene_type:complete
MKFYVYILLSKYKQRFFSYVGYTANLNNRIRDHNNSRGAKYTRGKKWILIYKKKYKTKSLAMKNEYKLKKNRKLRQLIKYNFINKNGNFNFTSL